VIIAGSFNDLTDFDPGAGTFLINNPGFVDQDLFILKLDSDGNFIWAKAVDSFDDIRVYAIAIDGNNGIVLTGVFGGAADFDPGAGTYNLSAGNNDDIFIMKLSSNGNFAWAGQLNGNSSFDRVYALEIASNNDVVIAGNFGATIDMDPGSASQLFTATG
jgi:hypothetical protein